MKFSHRGFTLIELLLTMALFVTVSVMSVAFYSRFLTQNAVANTVDQLTGQLRKAQTYAMAGKQNSNWGVHYGSNQIILFQGNTYAGRTVAFDEKFTTNSNITITGLTDVIFSRVTGTPSASLAVTITGANNTRTISVNELGVVGGGSGGSTVGVWFNTSYLFKKKITIDHNQVIGGADLSNFPVLISLTDANLKTIANGGSVQNSNGYDIIFTDSTETTEYDHEIEKYVPTTGEMQMWVRLPLLSASVDTVLYMYYNNSLISTTQENVATVWDGNYRGVWHMEQSPAGTAPQILDSTINALHATANGTMTVGQQITGKVDGSLNFDGTNDYLSRADTALLEPSSDISISFWSKLDTLPTVKGENEFFVTKLHGSAPWYSYQIGVVTPNNVISVNWANNSGTDLFVDSSTVLTAGTWYYVTFIKSGTTGKIYLNGLDITQDSSVLTGTIFNSNSEFRIGAVGGSDERVDGIVDEVRVSGSARSAGWVRTEYNNQNVPSTFFSIGAATGQ